MRDLVIQRICEFLINTFATRQYRAFCIVVVAKGIKALDDDLGLERVDGELRPKKL